MLRFNVFYKHIKLQCMRTRLWDQKVKINFVESVKTEIHRGGWSFDA